MIGVALVGVINVRVAERVEVGVPFAVHPDPRHCIILVGARAERAHAIARGAIRFLDIDAQQHVLLLA